MHLQDCLEKNYVYISDIFMKSNKFIDLEQ